MNALLLRRPTAVSELCGTKRASACALRIVPKASKCVALRLLCSSRCLALRASLGGDPEMDRFDAPAFDPSDMGNAEQEGKGDPQPLPQSSPMPEADIGAEGKSDSLELTQTSEALSAEGMAGRREYEDVGGTMDSIAGEHSPSPYHGQGVGRKEDVRATQEGGEA